MITFKQFITESYRNLFTSSEKKKYAEEAFAQLQQSYEKVGGLHGSGFKNQQDLIQNIPFWKLNVVNGKIIAAAYYKDKNGRKRVAISSDGSPAGKKAVSEIMVSDLLHGRAYVEQSAAALSFLVKQIGYDEIKKRAIEPTKIAALLKEELKVPPSDDPELQRHPALKGFFYQRKIGDELHTKIAIGTPGKQIKT